MVLKQKVKRHPSQLKVLKGLKLCSKHHYTYLFTERCPPQDISITPTFLGSSKAMVKWHFADQDLHLSEFRVQVDGGENTVLSASVREAKIQGLRPSAINPVTVTAIYKDGVKTECCLNYKNDSKFYVVVMMPLKKILTWQTFDMTIGHFCFCHIIFRFGVCYNFISTSHQTRSPHS